MNTERPSIYRSVPLSKSLYGSPDYSNPRDPVADAIEARAAIYKLLYQETADKQCIKRALKLERQANRYRYCSEDYINLQCSGCKTRLIGSCRCESRICPDCSRKYAFRIMKRETEVAKRLQPKGGRKLMLLTLTLKKSEIDTLSCKEIRFLNQSARKLINTLYSKKKGCGALAIMEVGKSFNLHIHALVYGFFIPQKLISDLWFRITGDSQIVDIRVIKSPKKAVFYILKYINKPPEFESPEMMALYFDSIVGIRRIHKYGEFYNYPLCKKEPFPCPLCGSKLLFCSIDGGTMIPAAALFVEEAIEKAKAA